LDDLPCCLGDLGLADPDVVFLIFPVERTCFFVRVVLDLWSRLDVGGEDLALVVDAASVFFLLVVFDLPDLEVFLVCDADLDARVLALVFGFLVGFWGICSICQYTSKGHI
jgi:hypothetical protein